MPMYTLICSRCNHSKERGFTFAALKAQESQKFAFITCPMCSRRGTMSHDFMADETEAEIVARWSGALSSGKKSSENKEVAVDTGTPVPDTITSKPWPALKAQAKSLGIKVANTIKRPELERLVRDQLTT